MSFPHPFPDTADSLLVSLVTMLKVQFKEFCVKLENATPEATAALEAVLRLAGSAPVPLCSSVFNVAAETVKMINVRVFQRHSGKMITTPIFLSGAVDQ